MEGGIESGMGTILAALTVGDDGDGCTGCVETIGFGHLSLGVIPGCSGDRPGDDPLDAIRKDVDAFRVKRALFASISC